MLTQPVLYLYSRFFPPSGEYFPIAVGRPPAPEGWFTFQLCPLSIGFRGYSGVIFHADQYDNIRFPEKTKMTFRNFEHALEVKKLKCVNHNKWGLKYPK